MKTIYSLMLISIFAVYGDIRQAPAYYAQKDSRAFRNAYEDWQRVLDGSPISSDPFFFNKDAGTKEQQDAIKAVLAFGPEAVPDLVLNIRSEGNRMHLYRAIMLLEELAGINVYISYNKNIHDEIFVLRDKFLREWDSGDYLEADRVLAKTGGRYLKKDLETEQIDPRSLVNIRYFGIYAMPFIIRGIRDYDSPECYAAFLIITKQREKYAEYISHAKQNQITSSQKMDDVKKWYADNHERLERMNNLGLRTGREIVK